MSDTLERLITPRERTLNPTMVRVSQILTPISWFAVVAFSTVYTFKQPPGDPAHGEQFHSIWAQNSYHRTPFTLNALVTSIYWLVVWTLQIPFLINLYAPESLTADALALAPYHTLSNVFAISFVYFWTHGSFFLALFFAILNFVTLTFAFFSSSANKTPLHIHVPVVAAPLAFAFVALFWDGAVAFHGHRYSLFARILANFLVWTWGVYGLFYVVYLKDWAVAFSLSVLSLSLFLAQFLLAVIAFQWIFAIVIATLLMVASLAAAFPDAMAWRRQRASDGENAPLLADDSATAA